MSSGNLDEKLPGEVESGGIPTENAKDIILDVHFLQAPVNDPLTFITGTSKIKSKGTCYKMNKEKKL
ncbi:MAG TPA: hypothetical protein VN370_11375 [Desulfitobacteriaceae bacterium]|nr:hypothetical protein [Desulfitobacteriaceae bacterium]